MTTATEPTCGDRVLAVIGYAIAAAVVGAAVLVWAASTYVAGQVLVDVSTDAGVGLWVFVAVGVVPIPVTLALGVRLRAWRHPHRLASVTITTFLLVLLTFYVASTLAFASSLGGY